MTNKNEMLLKNCPFCDENLSTNDVVAIHYEKPKPSIRYAAVCECGAMGAECVSEEKAIEAWNTRAAQPHPPVIEGLDEAMQKFPLDVLTGEQMGWFLKIEKAARLYAQGQTAQPATGECPNSGNPCSCSNDDNCVTRESASDGTINKTVKPDEDAQRALDDAIKFMNYMTKNAQSQISKYPNNSGREKEIVKHFATIRAALARGLGE